MAQRPHSSQLSPSHTWQGFLRESQRPVHRLKGRTGEKAASLQGEAKSHMDPEGLALLATGPCVVPRDREKKRTKIAVINVERTFKEDDEGAAG